MRTPRRRKIIGNPYRSPYRAGIAVLSFKGGNLKPTRDGLDDAIALAALAILWRLPGRDGVSGVVCLPI